MYGYVDEAGRMQQVALPYIRHITGSPQADVLAGDRRDNILRGQAGNDVLYGGPEGGDDLLEGGEGNDTLYGGLGNDTLAGGAGNDALQGGEGDDVLYGGPGDDVLRGAAGADRLSGGGGEDTASYSGSAAGVTVRLHSFVAGGGDAEGDTFESTVTVGYTDEAGATQEVALPDIMHLTGSSHADVLAGDRRDNTIRGAAGDDLLYGGPGGGDDVLEGEEGNDTLYGGQGEDVLDGGKDTDRLHGGPGNDVFLFEAGDGEDVIADFTDAEDRIDLTSFALPGFGELALEAVPNGVKIHLPAPHGGTILLEDFGITNLDATDFLF